MFLDVGPFYIAGAPEGDTVTIHKASIYKAYCQNIDALNKSMEDMRQCYWNEVNDLKKEIYEKDNRIKALTDALFEALEVIKKCKYK